MLVKKKLFPIQARSMDEAFDTYDDYDGESGGRNGIEWLMGSIPGVPGRDYPILDHVPLTAFYCSGKPPGYYADVETACQVNILIS